jgi:uncharacterized protein YbaR (Trm112 family)
MSSYFPKQILDILVCPLTRGSLYFDKTTKELVSASARLAYPIKNGIPILIPDEARELEK